MTIVTFTVAVEADLDGQFATTPTDMAKILAEMEEIVAKRGLSLHDSEFEIGFELRED